MDMALLYKTDAMRVGRILGDTKDFDYSNRLLRRETRLGRWGILRRVVRNEVVCLFRQYQVG
jgi:hypothetical protein